MERVRYCSGAPPFLGGTGTLSDAGRHAHADVLLKEAGFARAFRAADETERTANDVRKHMFRDGGVVLGELAFGELRLLIEDFVGMGQAHAGDFVC